MPKLPTALPVAVRSTLILASAIVVAACGGAPASASTAPGSAGPSPSAVPTSTSGPPVGTIDHKTGATDVLLRIQEGGGFVPIEFHATAAPGFTLYGNGVIVFQRLVQQFPEADENGVVRSIPWRTAKLDEDQIQELLAFALGPGALATARESYRADGIADASDTIFTIRAGGIDKTVVINALFELTQPGPDAVARAAFFKLAQRLRDFDRGGSIESDVFEADRYRGVLIEREAQAGITAIDWPWPAVKLTDFKEPANDGTRGPAFPHRVMTPDEIVALKLTDIEGGFQGVTLKGPNGRFYSFILRPLLADEAA